MLVVVLQAYSVDAFSYKSDELRFLEQSLNEEFLLYFFLDDPYIKFSKNHLH